MNILKNIEQKEYLLKANVDAQAQRESVGVYIAFWKQM